MRNLFLFLFVLAVASCSTEADRAAAFEGTYRSQVAYANYDRIKVTKVDKQTVSLQYSLKDSAQFVLIPNATFTSDSSLSFDTQSSIGNSASKFNVKGTALIYLNRLIVDAKATNTANEIDFYNIPFDGSK